MAKQNIFRIVIFLSVATFVQGCNNIAMDNDNNKNQALACPTTAPIPNIEVLFNYASSLPPTKISVLYNGVQKFNSCSPVTSSDSPRAEVSFLEANPRVVVTYNFTNTAQPLPNEASLEVRDLKDCIQAPSVLHQGTTALDWKDVTFGDAGCNTIEKKSKVIVEIN